ncbi:hypothetical protein [Alkaliphilus sp. B6464]|uniref:hypothetical protein n=1 Tax=Alkaliphilus sp. B6464 TaxID=2731219 RepID=UPI001BA9B352|nr:hypothetical protein [Alkaliphilus sp. B6464]QUH22019.1 hypothetical protein HYG84_19125 [Alkaliphilus sp. B6464]
MRFKQNKRKGSIIIVSLFFILASIALFGFAYDISRIMYFKMYTRNLASAVAISIVNETGYSYHDKNSGARSILIYNEDSVPIEYIDPVTGMNNYKGKYANSTYAWELIKKNKDGMDKTLNITGVYLNPNVTLWGTSTNFSRFLTGHADGKNGEVEVLIEADMEMFFVRNWWGGKYHHIKERAIAQPFAIEIPGSDKEQENQKNEEWNYF